jgi:uncharacterized protein YndB with AHSA1/START domain
MTERVFPWEDGALHAKAADAVVHVTREYPVPREEVFAAWTEPDLMSQWFRPQSGSSTVELDVRPNGRYRIATRPTDGLPPADIVGSYLEIVPPERLVFTFGWEFPPADEIGELEDLGDRLEVLAEVDSRVTVQFRDLGSSTEVSITHEKLADQGLRAFHMYGWESVLARLADLL